MTGLRTIFAITAALGASPAFADQTWWVQDWLTPPYGCRQPKGDYWDSPATVYEDVKTSWSNPWPLPQPTIADKGDEVDVTWFDGEDQRVTFYRTEDACLKAVQTVKDDEAVKKAAADAAKTKEDKFLEKYR